MEYTNQQIRRSRAVGALLLTAGIFLIFQFFFVSDAGFTPVAMGHFFRALLFEPRFFPFLILALMQYQKKRDIYLYLAFGLHSIWFLLPILYLTKALLSGMEVYPQLTGAVLHFLISLFLLFLTINNTQPSPYRIRSHFLVGHLMLLVSVGVKLWQKFTMGTEEGIYLTYYFMMAFMTSVCYWRSMAWILYPTPRSGDRI